LNNWFWIDTETTGLDPKLDSLLEVAVVVTTPQLEEMFEVSTLIEYVAPKKNIDPFVLEMHAKNGLWDELKSADTAKLQVSGLADWLRLIAEQTGCARGEAGNGGPLCGSSVGFDRAFLAEKAPGFLRCVSHRNVDVSTIHMCVQAWFVDSHSDAQPTHRALDDIRGSLDRLRFYKRRNFMPYNRLWKAEASK